MSRNAEVTELQSLALAYQNVSRRQIAMNSACFMQVDEYPEQARNFSACPTFCPRFASSA
jgi:hypothetical protein